MVSVVGGNALAGPTGAELAQQGARNFGQGAQALAQLMEQRFAQDQANATTQIANMAKESGVPLPIFLKSDAGKQAVMAFAPKLFRGLNAKKKAEQWLAAYDAAPLEGQQALKAVEDAKLRGELVPETQYQPGQAPDFRSFLPVNQQTASESTPAQAPTQPVNAPGLPPPPQAAAGPTTPYQPINAVPDAGNLMNRAAVAGSQPPQSDRLAAYQMAAGVSPQAAPSITQLPPSAAQPPAAGPSTEALPPSISFRDFLVAKAARVPGISVSAAGSESDEELMAKAPASRREYEAYKRGIAPAWANRPAAAAAQSTAETAPTQATGSITEGADLSRARAIGITDDEIAALQALNTATDPSQLDDKTQVLYSRALAKIETASRKEIKRYKFTPEARARLSEANANMLETVAANIEEDSPLRGDPRMSHIFENPTQINIDAAKSEIALKNAQATKALVDAGYAGEELALKKRQIEAMEVAAAAEAIQAQSPAFKDIVAALDASLKRREEEIGNILKNAKTPKEYEKARAEVNSILAKDPVYNREKESWTKLMGEWGKLGLTPVDIALVRRGLFGGLKQEGTQTTIGLSPTGGAAAMDAGGSLYNDQSAVDSLAAKYGF